VFWWIIIIVNETHWNPSKNMNRPAKIILYFDPKTTKTEKKAWSLVLSFSLASNGLAFVLHPHFPFLFATLSGSLTDIVLSTNPNDS
jgi:hypothetical protein